MDVFVDTCFPLLLSRLGVVVVVVVAAALARLVMAMPMKIAVAVTRAVIGSSDSSMIVNSVDG